MPTASPELRAEWHEEGDSGAIKFLEGQGYILLWDWRWLVNKQPDEKSCRAMAYLIDEWDFGGWLTPADFYKELREGTGKIKAERDRYREALERIACFHDQFGNAGLTVENTYVGFDEPVSVKIARQALEGDK